MSRQQRRVQVGELGQGPRITPTASPVNARQAPEPMAIQPAPVNPGGGLAQLAQALGVVNNALLNKVEQKGEEQKQQALAEAEQLAMENQSSWKALVQQQPELAGKNPWLEVSYNQAQLRRIASEFDSKARKAWATSPDRDNPNSDFDQLFNPLQGDLIKSLQQEGYNPRDIAKIVLPEVARSREALSKTHLEHQAKVRVERAKEGLGSDVGLVIGRSLDGWEQRYEEAKKADPKLNQKTWWSQQHKSAGELISQYGKEAIDKGLSGSDANNLMAEAVIAYARERQDPELLNILDHVKTGTGVLSGIADIRAKRVTARDAIENEVFREWSRNDRMQDEEERKQRGALLDELNQRLLANPDADIGDLQRKASEIHQPDLAIQLQQAAINARRLRTTVIEDPRVKYNLGRQVLEDPQAAAQQADALFQEGKVSAGTALQAQRAVKADEAKRAREAKAADARRKQVMLQAANSTIDAAYAGGKSILGGSGPGRQAKAFYKQKLQNWFAQNPNANSEQLQKALQSFQRATFQQYKPSNPKFQQSSTKPNSAPKQGVTRAQVQQRVAQLRQQGKEAEARQLEKKYLGR